MNDIEELKKRVEKLEDQNHNIDKVVSVISEKLDNIIKSLDKLTLQNERRSTEIDEKYENLEKKINLLEKEIDERTTKADAKKWQNFVWIIFSGVVMAVLGFVLAMIGIK